MARIIFKTGNGGLWGYSDLTLFDVSALANTGFSGLYNGGSGPYDPFQHAWRFEASVSDGVVRNGAGGPFYTAGTVTQVDYFNASGDLLLSLRDLSVNVAVFTTLLAQHADAWGFLLRGAHSFIGADDSAASDWDGDDIKTGAGRDSVLAKGGDDYITDFGGADRYVGGAGTDTVTYDQWQWMAGQTLAGIVADLAAGTIRGPDGTIDRVISIEAVRGTFLADRMLGDGADNRLYGLQGKDYFDGRGGFDTLRYDRDERRGGLDGISVNMKTGTARDGFGQIDRFRGIEGVIGTEQADTFRDNAGGSYFDGRGGADVFILTAGSDYVQGGNGADNFRFLGTFGADVVTDFDAGEGDRITLQGPAGFDDLGIAQSGADAVVSFGANTITLQGVSAAGLEANDFEFL